MRVLKTGLRSLENRAKRHFNASYSRERWLKKNALKTNATSPAGLPCVGGLAAIPSRETALAEMITSVIDQFDHLYVYLNGFEQTPAFLINEKITVFRSQETGDLGDVGKFFGTQYVDSGLYFTLDDDIVYPPDYRSRMEACLRQFNYKAAVGVHGAFYAWNPDSFFDRQVIHYRAGNDEIRPVSLLGTGTVCFSIDEINVNLDWFKSANMADIWFGGHLKRKGLPALCIDRSEGWLKDAESVASEPDSSAIYDATRSDPTPYNRALSEFSPWGRRDIAQRIEGSSGLSKRYKHFFSVSDYSQLIAANQEESLAQKALLEQLAPMQLKHCAEQDVQRYFDSYECTVWSTLLVEKKRPDFSLALAVIKKAMPVATEQAASNAKNVMRSAASRKDRRSMLRGSLVYMRAMQRLELFSEVLETHNYVCSFGEPSAQISLEYLIALLSQGHFEEACRYLNSSPLRIKYDMLPQIVEWLCAPQSEPLIKLVDGYFLLEKAGLKRALRSNLFNWVATVQVVGTGSISEAELVDLKQAISENPDGVSAVKLLVQAGARSVARECFDELLQQEWFQPHSIDNIEIELAKALVSEPGVETLNCLNNVFKAHQLMPLKLSETGSFFDGLKSSDQSLSVKSFGKVSIVMTCKDSSSTIRYAIGSILGQSYQDLELIVVDDGSSDSTKDIVNEFRAADSRVRLIENNENLGIYASRNRAIKIASGEFVGFQDADDYSHPQRIELQVEPLRESKEVVASSSGHVRLSSAGGVCLENNLLVFGHGPVNWIYRKAVFDKIGLFEEVRTRGDIEFIKRLKVHYPSAQIKSIELPLLLALHDLNTNSWRESRGSKVQLLTKQRESHAREHYVARHRNVV